MDRKPDGPTIAVVGAGAVGGYIGGRLAAAGYDVRFLARGENLAALRTKGLRITNGSTELTVPEVRASDDPRDLGEADYVLLCVKTPQLPAVVETLPPMVGQDTAVLTLQNGVEAPEQVAAGIGRDRVLPGTVRVLATTLGPGEVAHLGGPGVLGFAEWDGSVSARVVRLREVLRDARLTVVEPPDIWADLWAKFLLVVPVGSLGAATGGATIGELRSRAGTRKLLIAGIRENYGTAVGLGIALPGDAVETAIGMMDRQPPDITSSLQRDILAGRLSELEAWTGAAVRLANSAGRAAPVHETLYELLATRASRISETL